MYDKEWRYLFIDGTPGLFQCLAKFQFKLKKHLPQIYEHFKKLGIVKFRIYNLRLIWEHALLIII